MHGLTGSGPMIRAGGVPVVGKGIGAATVVGAGQRVATTQHENKGDALPNSGTPVQPKGKGKQFKGCKEKKERVRGRI